MNYWALSAVILLTVWAILVFAVAPHTGWVHVPLGVGVILMARGIVGKPREGS